MIIVYLSLQVYGNTFNVHTVFTSFLKWKNTLVLSLHVLNILASKSTMHCWPWFNKSCWYFLLMLISLSSTISRPKYHYTHWFKNTKKLSITVFKDNLKLSPDKKNGFGTPTFGGHAEQQSVISIQPVKCQRGTWRIGTATQIYGRSERYLPFRQILKRYINKCVYFYEDVIIIQVCFNSFLIG